MTLGDHRINLPLARQESEVEGNYGLVVDGASLQLLLDLLKDEFYAVCQRCIAVVCCRMSPKQKAEVGFLPFLLYCHKGIFRYDHKRHVCVPSLV